jgi:hypothetical protein
MTGQLYQMRITATGTVRDDGNVVSEQPIEAIAILTEDEVQALTQGEKS